jgi:N-acetylneuraminic acid mutarotase
MLVYSPSTDSWREVVVPPSGPADVTVWTGDEIIFWGFAYHQPELGPVALAWRPSDGRWREFDRGPLSFRELPGATWTGREMVIVGGTDRSGGTSVPEAAAYDPATDTWRVLAVPPLPPLPDPAAVWTGNEVLVWGSNGLQTMGAAYDPATDTWRAIANPPDVGRIYPVVVWTGAEMLVLEGTADGRGRAGESGHGAAYDPSTDTWRLLATIPGPATCQSAAVWTGADVIVWGGSEGCDFTPNVPRQGGYVMQLLAR